MKMKTKLLLWYFVQDKPVCRCMYSGGSGDKCTRPKSCAELNCPGISRYAVCKVHEEGPVCECSAGSAGLFPRNVWGAPVQSMFLSSLLWQRWARGTTRSLFETCRSVAKVVAWAQLYVWKIWFPYYTFATCKALEIRFESFWRDGRPVIRLSERVEKWTNLFNQFI